MRSYAAALGIAGVVLAAACSSAPDAGEPASQAVTEDAFSYVGQAVLYRLRAQHGQMRGKTWDFSGDNAFEPGWVLQSPLAEYWGHPAAELPMAESCNDGASCDPDFHLVRCASPSDCGGRGTCTPVAATVTMPGESPRSLCVGHSDAIYDAIYGVLREAESVVDITTLAPPDGRFEAALRNALTYLSHAGRPIRARLIYGDIIGTSEPSPEDLVASLTRDVDPASGLRLSVAQYRVGFTSWDHAKIISVDGKVAIVGGENLWTQHYLERDPVHDVSIRVRGSAAAQASRFINQLWEYTCAHGGGFGGSTEMSDFPRGTNACDEPFHLPPSNGPGTSRVIAAGRLGAIGDDASDDAMLAMLDAAKTSVRLSQQDIGPPYIGGIPAAGWPEPYMRAILLSLERGVDIKLILSNKDASPNSLHDRLALYSNGYTPEDVLNQLATFAKDNPALFPPGTDVTALLCNKLAIAPLRLGADDTWPDGAPFANHAKLAIVDDRAFYVGSQNWYSANLAEFGYIVDDEAAARELVESYYEKAWAGSRRAAVSGADASRCALRAGTQGDDAKRGNAEVKHEP